MSNRIRLDVNPMMAEYVGPRGIARAELFWETVWVEAVGAVVLAVLAVLSFPRARTTRGTPSRTDRVRVR